MRRVVVVAASLAAAAGLAQVPNKLGYQGRLLRGDGAPESGIVAMNFNVYDAATGATTLGCDAAQVALSDGFYSILLGDLGNCPGGAPAIAPALFDGRELYLELVVGGLPLAPRQRIGTVAYAHRAGNAVNLRGGTVEASSVTVGGASGMSITNTGIALGGTTVVDGSGKATVATGAGLTGNGSTAVPVRVASGGVTSAMLASDSQSLGRVSAGALGASGSTVGVGTLTPQGLLDVNSGGSDTSALFVRADPAIGNRGGVIHHQSSTYAWQEVAQGTGSATGGLLTFNYVDRSAPGTKVASYVLTLRASGNVGVGQLADGNNADYSVSVERHGTGAVPGTYTAGTPALSVIDLSGDGPTTPDPIGVVTIGAGRIADGDANAHNANILYVGNDNGAGLKVDGRRNVFVGYQAITNNTLNRSLMVQDRVGIGTSTPQNRLDVAGNEYFYPQYTPAQVLAEATCTALKVGGGWTFAVPRPCSGTAPDCATLCASLTEAQAGTLSCFNSLHIYGNQPAEAVSTLGLKTHRYNACGGGCGPNYCCCGN